MYSIHCSYVQVTSFSNFYSGDPYIGTRAEEIKKKNDEIASLQKEVKRLKQELAAAAKGGSYGDRRDGFGGGYSTL